MAQLINGNRVPLYQQVAQTLRQRVRTGVYRANAPLPPLRELGAEFGVSTHAVQNAIYALEKDRIVVTQHGKGILVVGEKPCEQAAILFGMIEPYEHSHAFEGIILRMAEEVFNRRDDLMVARSSGGDPARERAAAEHFVRNGVKGIMLWPVENDPNGPFFSELAKSVPVVILDREVKACPLPKVLCDLEGTGRDVCARLLGGARHRKLLVLLDTLGISPYRDFTAGVRRQAAELGREEAVAFHRLPATEILRRVAAGDYSLVDRYRQEVGRLIARGGYGAVFCLQDEIIDYLVVESGLAAQHPGLQLGTLTALGGNTRSRAFNEAAVLTWFSNQPLMIQTAADLLQQWVYTRRRPRSGQLLPMPLVPAPGKPAAARPRAAKPQKHPLPRKAR